MPVTHEEFAEFTAFAEKKLSNGGVDSMTDLFRSWIAQCNAADVDAAIREGLADIAAGRTQPHDEFMQEVRQKLEKTEP